MVHLVLVLEHPRVDALVGFRTSKESPSHVPLPSSFCYLSRLVVIYPSHLCHSLSCFFLLPAPRPNSQFTTPRSPATSPTLRPPTPQLPVTSTYRDQLAWGRVLPGIGQLIQGPAHTGPSSSQWPGLAGIASTYGDQLAPVVKATREGDRPFGKEAGHLRKRQVIGKGGQGHLGGGRPFRKEAKAHIQKKKNTKEGREGRKGRIEKTREEKGRKKERREEIEASRV